jgi:t-SNARE complex subunit (syntaxin)
MFELDMSFRGGGIMACPIRMSHSVRFLFLFHDDSFDNFQRMRSRIRDEVLVVNPEASEDQIAAVVEQGGGEVFAGDILHGRHEEAKENFLMIADQHRDILRIEESLAELHQIFVDMAALVEMQGDVLENIMKNVSKSVSYTEAGLKEVIKAEEYQKKARKVCSQSSSMFELLI